MAARRPVDLITCTTLPTEPAAVSGLVPEGFPRTDRTHPPLGRERREPGMNISGIQRGSRNSEVGADREDHGGSSRRRNQVNRGNIARPGCRRRSNEATPQGLGNADCGMHYRKSLFGPFLGLRLLDYQAPLGTRHAGRRQAMPTCGGREAARKRKWLVHGNLSLRMSQPGEK
jgi:hypothetical protein